MDRMPKESQVSVFSQSIFSATPSSSFASYSSAGRPYDQNDSDSEDDDFFSDNLFVREEPSAVKWVINSEAYCFDVEKFSEKLVDATYIEATKRLAPKKKQFTYRDVVSPVINELINQAVVSRSDSHFSRVNTDPWSSSYFMPSYNMSSEMTIEWPKISGFNIKLGLEKIEDYVQTWDRQYDWMFCVEFLGFESEDCSNIFVYEVEWSKPTNAYPIPQATASVYFALEVYKMVPYNYDRNIEVTYVFETSNIIHQPGRIDFQEKWLDDILEAKLRFFKTVTFSVPKGLDCDVPARSVNRPKESSW